MKQNPNSNRQKQSDGVIDTTTAFQSSENRMYVEKGHNPEARKKILQWNADVKREMPLTPEVMRKHKLILSIPEGDRPFLQQSYPDMLSTNMQDKANAYKQIATAFPEYIQHIKR